MRKLIIAAICSAAIAPAQANDQAVAAAVLGGLIGYSVASEGNRTAPVIAGAAAGYAMAESYNRPVYGYYPPHHHNQTIYSQPIYQNYVPVPPPPIYEERHVYYRDCNCVIREVRRVR